MLAICALAPVALVQSGTINADAMTTALVLLVIAEAFHLRTLAADEIRWPQLAEPAAALVALGLAKQPYVLVAAFFLVPMWHHRGRIAAWLGAELGVAATIPPHSGAIGRRATSSPPTEARSPVTGTASSRSSTSTRTSSSRSCAAIRSRSSPRSVARSSDAPTTLPRDIFTQAPVWRAGVIIVLLTIAMLVVTVLIDALPVPGGRFADLLGAGVAGVLTLAVFATAYLGWNAVGAPRIDAFQGRYLFPVVATILIVAIPSVRTRLANLRYAPMVLAAAAMLEPERHLRPRPPLLLTDWEASVRLRKARLTDAPLPRGLVGFFAGFAFARRQQRAFDALPAGGGDDQRAHEYGDQRAPSVVKWVT